MFLSVNVIISLMSNNVFIFLVMVAEKHIKNPKSEGKPFPYTLVTLLVDKIDFTGELPKVREIVTRF